MGSLQILIRIFRVKFIRGNFFNRVRRLVLWVYLKSPLVNLRHALREFLRCTWYVVVFLVSSWPDTEP